MISKKSDIIEQVALRANTSSEVVQKEILKGQTVAEFMNDLNYQESVKKQGQVKKWYLENKYTSYIFWWIDKYSAWWQFVSTPNDERMNVGVMKQLGTSILLSCVLLSGCAKEPVEMDVLSSHSATSANWYELDISVIADKDTVLDRDACSNEIIQHVLDNDFHSTRFSYDLSGYPNEVTVEVYTSEKNFKKGKEAYSFEYVTDFNTEDIDIQNNIKDNPDEFEIQYK